MEQSFSLINKLGGSQTIELFVEKFYSKVLNDNEVRPFFTKVNMVKLRNMQVSFLTYALGGSTEYHGKSLRDAHESVVKSGMNEQHFNIVAGYFLLTLEELISDKLLIDDIKELVLGLKNDVLNR
jgi:hemoglobin